MSDPRNVAHGKKVAQEKQHEQTKSVAGSKKKSGKAKQPAPADNPSETPSPEAVKVAPGELERSVVVLSKLKDLEFHSRANIEALALLTLTIEDELKHKEFVEPIGGLYSAQDTFHSQIVALIESYEAKCESLKPPA
jgi:hypothetical protein